MEDRTIVKLLWQRAEAALTQVQHKFGPRLQQTAVNILGNVQDAEESVSDTYLEIWNTIPPHRPDPLAGFVYRIGRNLALDRLRYNMAQCRNTHYDLCIDDLQNYLPAQALEEQMEARELGRAINRFLGTLKAEDRNLFLRRYWFGDEIREIAHFYGKKPNTVTVRLRRICEKLRQFLIREAILDEPEAK